MSRLGEWAAHQGVYAILGLYRYNGKENGNDHNIVYYGILCYIIVYYGMLWYIIVYYRPGKRSPNLVQHCHTAAHCAPILGSSG